MSCSSCSGHPLHNCDCTTYQLPVGPTGAAGSTGATGATGPAGAVVIADIIVNQATTTTGSYETLYTYTLSNPSPLDEAGDTLLIQAYWSDASPSTAARPIRIQIGGNTILGMGIGLIPGSYLNHTKVSLSRVSTTTAALATEELSLSNIGTIASGILSHMFYHLPNQLNAAYQTVPNLDSGAHAITFAAYSTAVGDIHLDRIVILKLEKA